ncbi:hypothetical protein TrVE_jg8050 [Triparma verrucosa]|uniref:Cytochrome b561 domain-containing protein n=1 Tax=Triparma verrucosa TaxID=1606542 RepID=A0A9W7ETG4_9STRA|nr:hypothetical protein TrVE_jg8050 [Triparma verrucosa]
MSSNKQRGNSMEAGLLPTSSGQTPTNSSQLSSLQLTAATLTQVLCATMLVQVFVIINNAEFTFGNADNTGFSLDKESKKVFNAHPVLMTVSFVLMTVGKLSFTIPFITNRLSRPKVKVVHGSSWLLALISSSFALYAVFASHNVESQGYKANMYSLHSWVGIAVFAAMIGNFLIGSVAFGFQLVEPETRGKLMPFHKLFGNLIYYGWGVAMILGLLSRSWILSCGYSVTEADVNPAEHYNDLPETCRQMNGLGMEVLATIVLVSVASMKN